MPPVHWFPGHMATARRAIREAMPGVDLVMEVLDARIPWSSQNPLVAELRGNKPLLRILNKADLADPSETARWVAQLSIAPEARVCVHALGQRGVREHILRLVRELVGATGAHVPVAMIVGVPNVGKSSLLNLLAGRTLARAGNTPGLTQKQQRVDLGRDLAIVDTPGFLWPRLSPPECGERLAVTGAIPDRVTNAHALACFALRFLRQRYGGALTRHYKLPALPEEDEALLEAVGRRRGYLLRGGVVEIERAAARVLLDLREGAFGGLTFERPEDIPAADALDGLVSTDVSQEP